ncbi:MAG: hypothetical protein GY866_28410 [Proteobacteria bacterium]|nr:hypothetical protein [Pseudomonadota bacterium]
MKPSTIFKVSLKNVLVCAAILALAGTAGAKNAWEVWDYSKEKPVRGGIYRTTASRSVGLMNPNHWPVNDWMVINYFFEKLLTTDGNYKPVPWMVESWRFAQPNVCVMTLKKGITFTDGTPFNAAALKYQIEWIQNKKNGTWSRGWLTPVKSIQTVDEYTVKWTFEYPWAAFLGIAANVPGYVISPRALEADGLLREAKNWKKKLKSARKRVARAEKKVKEVASKKARSKLKKARKGLAKTEKLAAVAIKKAEGLRPSDINPVGTGKWILQAHSPGNYTKVRRNPNWWYGKSIGRPDMPYFDGLVTTIIPDPSVQLANLRAGKVDRMTLSKSQYRMVKRDRNLNVFVSPANHVRALRYNLAKGPCRDIRVRQAVNMAIDRKALIVGTEFGLGRPATSLFPEDHWVYNPRLKPHTYDPERAERLLAEAGYANGLTLTGYMLNAAQSRTWSEAISNMLGKAGIIWKPDILDMVAISDRQKNLEYDLAIGGWTWIYDPDLQASGLYHPEGGQNQGRSNNAEAIRLIEAGRREVDVEKRKKIYQDLQEVLYNNLEDVWLFYEMWPIAYNKRVRGYQNDMSIAHKEIWDWSHPMWLNDGSRR